MTNLQFYYHSEIGRLASMGPLPTYLIASGKSCRKLRST